MSKSVVSTTGAPAAIGPYSQAVRVGEFVFTSGQVALDPTTGAMVEGGIEPQTERVIANLEAVLAAAGLTFSHVLKTTVFLKDMGDFAPMNQTYERYLGKNSPARSTIQAARLPRDVSVEIDVIAAIIEPAPET